MVTDQGMHYQVYSPVSGKIFNDENWLLDVKGEEPSLLRSIYREKQLSLLDDDHGLFRFACWLPVNRMIKGSSSPVTFKSSNLASVLGLKNLFITFSGYWPEKGASMRTCSFKETEAYSVTARMNSSIDKILVVASAGNTARAFARVCSDNAIPLLVCIPEDNLDALWFDKPLENCVKVLSVRKGGDYYDAIHLSQLACQVDGFIAEGGAKNIARRDGMGTTVLSAVSTIGAIPSYYFQAIGSGTGAIAAWEANIRLIGDERFGKNKMKLMLSQNEPFHPIYDAWKLRSRTLLPMDDDQARKKVEMITAKVLSNRRPPYAVRGGLFDALNDTEGEVILVNNEEGYKAGLLFKETEGIDLHPAASVAVASLVKAVSDKKIEDDALIMLNITGGGEEKFKKEYPLMYAKPDLVVDLNPDIEGLCNDLKRIFNL
jgi:cysteate synthase